MILSLIDSVGRFLRGICFTRAICASLLVGSTTIYVPSVATIEPLNSIVCMMLWLFNIHIYYYNVITLSSDYGVDVGLLLCLIFEDTFEKKIVLTKMMCGIMVFEKGSITQI